MKEVFFAIIRDATQLAKSATHYATKRLVALAIIGAIHTGASPALATFHVLIDPGHGGIDTGTVHGKYKESEIALKVSLMLAEELRKDPRFQVSLTRTIDKTLTLKQRTDLAKALHPDLYLSIHLNSSSDKRAQGEEFYFQNQLPVDEESLFLANEENEESKSESASSAENLDSKSAGASAGPQNASTASASPDTHSSDSLSAASDVKRIIEDLNRNHRVRASSELAKTLLENWGVGRSPASFTGTGSSTGASSSSSAKTNHHAIRQAPFFVVSLVTMPSVLVELGFLSHPQESARLAQPEHQRAMAKSLVAGLLKFKETVDKERL